MWTYSPPGTSCTGRVVWAKRNWEAEWGGGCISILRSNVVPVASKHCCPCRIMGLEVMFRAWLIWCLCIEGIRKGARGAAQNVLRGLDVEFRVRVCVSPKGDAVILIGGNYRGLFSSAKGWVFYSHIRWQTLCWQAVSFSGQEASEWSLGPAWADVAGHHTAGHMPQMGMVDMPLNNIESSSKMVILFHPVAFIPIQQGCVFNAWSGHIGKSTNECMNWVEKHINASLFLSPAPFLTKSIN